MVSAHSDADTAWMLTSTALVIFMTLPGLILYYAGQAKVHHVIDIATHVLATFCVITLAWFSFGYSLALAPITSHRATSTPIYGDASRLWLRGMKFDTYHVNAQTIPEPIYCAFQLAFACITAALVGGSFAERVKLLPFLLFIVIWHFVVYCPIAHAVWHPDGFLYQAGVLDFAGGNVVHITAGCSGLVGTWVIGNRRGFARTRNAPHNLLLTFMGVAMLLFGWIGFNGGSSNQADGYAAMAVLNTMIAVVTSALSWTLTAVTLKSDEAPFLSLNNGLIAGLVAVTPACGFIDANGAFWCGFIAGALCNIGAKLKHLAGFDDALDAFGLHAIGGTIGCIITGFFALNTANDKGPVKSGVYYGSMKDGGHLRHTALFDCCLRWLVPIRIVLHPRSARSYHWLTQRECGFST